MLKIFDNCTMQIDLQTSQRRGNFYSNDDTIKGRVFLKNKQKLNIKSLNVSLNVVSTTILFDSKGTFVTCENRTLFEETVSLVIEDTLKSGSHDIPFKFKIPGDIESDKCFNLPPPLKFVGEKGSTKIDYSINALLEKQGSKSTLSASRLFNFVPNPFCTSYSLTHNKLLPASTTESSFAYKYTAGLSLDPQRSPSVSSASSAASSAASTLALSVASSQSSQSAPSAPMAPSASSGFKRFSSRIRKPSSPTTPKFTQEIECPFEISIEFDHAKVRNGKFAKGVINVPDNLSNMVTCSLVSKFSVNELYSLLYNVPVSEYHSFQENIVLSGIKVDLVTMVSFCCGKEVYTDSQKKTIMGKRNIDLQIPLSQFKKIRFKNSSYYKYELDSSIFDCIISNEFSSFISSCSKCEHQLQFKFDFYSEALGASKSVTVNTDVLLLGSVF